MSPSDIPKYEQSRQKIGHIFRMCMCIPHFIPKAHDVYEDLVVVCDGGTNHKLPKSPPQNKVRLKIHFLHLLNCTHESPF